MMEFIHFDDIKIDDINSWNQKAILSFDIDWASDEVVETLLSFLRPKRIKCTIFITHESPLLMEIRNDKNIELGIHPNFNRLFDPKEMRTPFEIISDLKKIVPEAKVLRSHTLTTSASWNDLFLQWGFKYISNYVMFGQQNIKPFSHINGLIEIPIYFADDGLIRIRHTKTKGFAAIEEEYKEDTFDGIRVFDFHPSHFFLNTNSLDRYEKSKEFNHNIDELFGLRNSGEGARSWLEALLMNS